MRKTTAQIFAKAVEQFNANAADEAFDLFNQVITIEGDFQEEGRDNAYFYLGCLYTDRDELQKAVECYSKSLGMWPDDENSFEGRGHCYREMGEYDKAINDFESIFRIDPNFRQMPGTDIYQEIWDTAVMAGRQGALLRSAAEDMIKNPDDTACEKLAVYVNCRLDACYSKHFASVDSKTDKLVHKIVQSIHEIRLLKFNLDDAFEGLNLAPEDLDTLRKTYYGMEGIAFDLERKVVSLDSLDESVRDELSNRWLFSDDEEEMEI